MHKLQESHTICIEAKLLDARALAAAAEEAMEVSPGVVLRVQEMERWDDG